MPSSLFFPFLLILLSPLISCSAFLKTLTEGSSISVNQPGSVLISPDRKFSAGFHSVGRNAFCFAVWFTEPSCTTNCTIVWMANRDVPVNGRHSKLTLLKTGNLVLTDAAQVIVWETHKLSISPVKLELQDTGNLILHNRNAILWQSFDSPTNTLLPQQLFTGTAQLVSSRSQTNFSSGFYSFYFDNDNLLRLLYHGPNISSVFGPPDPGSPWKDGRTTYNSSKVAILDSLGSFISSDNLTFLSADYGVNLQRRLTLDFDGNLRLYSRKEGTGLWVVSWQVFSEPCKIHGICGANSVCSHDPAFGRTCSCVPGFEVVNQSDWSFGFQPQFDQSNCLIKSTFLLLRHVEFYGYDFGFSPDTTLQQCEEICMKRRDCKGFQLKHDQSNGIPKCYPKTLLLNGQRSPSFTGDLYLKLPKNNHFSSNWSATPLNLGKMNEIELERKYSKRHENWPLRFLVWFFVVLGLIEICVVFFVWVFLIRTGQKNISEITGNAFVAATRFKRFTYAELKKATRNFKEEIGKGAGGTVYKGIFPDSRIAAIKRLSEANQGEAEFLAELNTISKLNHMNLIEIWGYCAERNHRLLVYEYMEHGSLAEILSKEALEWEKRFEIAIGTAKGLAYLHEACLEWVLHCDIKPQNILLDSNYQPKISDFGLSRLLSRSDELVSSSFSGIRGTRGYMAPEWVLKQPITSKVDVYSYGIVVLEMVTGKGPAMEAHADENREEVEHRRLVAWIRGKKTSGDGWVKEIVDPRVGSEFDMEKLETLVGVALQCVEEDKDARPTMKEVIEMLLLHHKDDSFAE